LDGLVDVAIDGGTANIGKASTVVDMTEGKPKVLREGVITQGDVDRETQKKVILFICTGNSCRSVMAEYLLKQRFHTRLNIEIFSAGTGVLIRSAASAETISVLRERGIDATKHISQPANTILLKQADLIFVMTRNHRNQILEHVPGVEKRVYLLKEFANISDSESDLDIPDPIGSSHQSYQDCLKIIEEAVEKIERLI
jgi:protein-tyrosine-phosphatase